MSFSPSPSRRSVDSNYGSKLAPRKVIFLSVLEIVGSTVNNERNPVTVNKILGAKNYKYDCNHHDDLT